MELESFKKYLNDTFPRTSSFISGLALFLVDATVLMLCISAGFFIVNLFAPDDINFRSFINYSIYIPLILTVFLSSGLYPGIMIPPTEELKKFCMCSFFSFIGICMSILLTNHTETGFTLKYILKDSQDIAVCIAFLVAFPAATIMLPVCREIARRLFSRFSWWGVPAVIYCRGDNADTITNRLLNNPYLGYKPAVIIDGDCAVPHFYGKIPVFPPSQEISRVIHDVNIKTAILCDCGGEDIADIMTAYRYTITVSKAYVSFTTTQQMKDIAGIIGFASINNLTFRGNLLIKRMIDILLVIVASPFLIPVFIVLSVLVKATSEGPVFYGHRRVGKNGKEIKCWKFRSMYIDADRQLEKILAENPQMRAEWERDRKFVNDPRVTGFGKFLRKTSLDELPQIINILCGEMSFVGPRPVTEGELSKYGKYKDFVLSVKPGLSGMWQISGRSDTGYEERISYDTYYIQNWSIWLDLWIIIKTVWVVLKGKGAY